LFNLPSLLVSLFGSKWHQTLAEKLLDKLIVICKLMTNMSVHYYLIFSVSF